jgi:hypothetical protein
MKTNQPAFRIGCLILTATVMNVGPSIAQTQEPAGASASATVISNVAVTQMSQRASVRVEGEGRLEVRTTRMQNPERLVLDSAERGWWFRRPRFPEWQRRCGECEWASSGLT